MKTANRYRPAVIDDLRPASTHGVVFDMGGKPVHLKDIGYIQVGYDQRRGIADLNGTGEVVGGIVIMEQQQNVLDVTRALDRKLRAVRASLPRGVDIVTAYDRSSLIERAIDTLRRTLIEEMVVVALVILVVFLFLRDGRATLIPAVAVPVSLVGTFAVMQLLGFSLKKNTGRKEARMISSENSSGRATLAIRVIAPSAIVT